MEKVKIIGLQYGTFIPDGSNVPQPYASIFCVVEFAGVENADYHFEGQKCIKYKCADKKVFDDVTIGEDYLLCFDSKKKVVLIMTEN